MDTLPKSGVTAPSAAAHERAQTINGTHWGMFHTRVQGNRVVAVEPFERDPHPGALISGVPEAVHAPNRVLKPALRRGWLEGKRQGRGADGYVEVSWDTVLELVQDELTRVRARYGNRAIFAGSYGWASAGRFHHAPTQLKRFLNCIGGFVDQTQTYSYAAGQIICPHVVGDNRILFGGVSTTWPAIIANAQLVVFFGGINLSNAEIGSGGLGRHATREWIKSASDAGIEFVSIGPKREQAAGARVSWLPLRPCTDTALMLGLAHTLAAEKLADRAFLERYCEGYEKFERYLLGLDDGQAKSADWAAGITAVPAPTIRELARRMAQSRTFLTGSWSLQRQDAGEQPMWMMITLAAMLGQIGLPGRGVAFGYGSMGNRGEPRLHTPSPAMAVGKNPIDLKLPVARVADMLLNPGAKIPFNGEVLEYPDTRLLWWAGGNPFHHHQDLNRLIKALEEKPDTIIVNELWWTSMAKHADIVLPAASTLERNDLSAAPTDRFVVALKKQIDPVGQARPEYEIFRALAERFGVAAAFTEGRDEMAWIRHIYEDFRHRVRAQGTELASFEEFWETGYAELPMQPREYTLYSDFRADPVGAPLNTPSGKIEICSARIAGFAYADIGWHAQWLAPKEWLGNAEPGMLHLISTQPATRLHGQLDGVGVSRQSKRRGREPVMLQPSDARERGITENDLVELYNERGRCLAVAVLCADLLPGVAQLPTGAWYDSAQPGTAGALEVHGNPNVLTPNRPTSSLSQGCAHHSTLVYVRKYAGAAPAVRAHEPPALAAAKDEASLPRQREAAWPQ